VVIKLKRSISIALLCIVLTVLSFILYPLINSAETPQQKIQGTITFNTKYLKCNHTEIYKTSALETFNDQKDIKEKYPSWEIKDITDYTINLEKTIDASCNNHFSAVLDNNKIKICRLNDNSVYKEFYISLKYLTEKDLNNLKQGIVFNSQKDLTSFLEDFTS
jgi:hypothetical protein